MSTGVRLEGSLLYVGGSGQPGPSQVGRLPNECQELSERVSKLTLQIASLTKELFEDPNPKFEIFPEAGPAMGDGNDFCRRVYHQLTQAQHILNACHAVFQVEGEQPIGEVLAEKEAQLSAIAHMVGESSDRRQSTQQKVQELLLEIEDLKKRNEEHERELSALKKEKMERTEMYNQFYRTYAFNIERIKVLDVAKATLHIDDDKHVIEKIYKLKNKSVSPK